MADSSRACGPFHLTHISSKATLGETRHVPSCSQEQYRLVESNQISIENLREFSRLSGEEEVLDTFCERQLGFIVEQSRRRKMTITQVFERLKLAIDTHEKETSKLEVGMDKALFKRIMLSGDIFRSGIEKKTNNLITWIDTAALSEWSWRCGRGSPQGKAWIRAILLVVEASHSLAWSVQDEDVHPVFFLHDGHRRLLDFNVVLLAEVARLCALIFPAENESIRIAGLSAFSGVWVSCWKSVFGERAKNWAVRDTLEDFKSFVKQETDIPQMYCSKGCKGKPFSAQDPMQSMFVDRILEGPKLNLREVLNPGPWMHPPFDYSGLRLDGKYHDKNLETIEEGNEDDGEW